MELCRSVDGARGAVFVAFDGECVQQAILDHSLTDYDLAVAGAHAAPILANPLGNRFLFLKGDEGTTIIRTVKDGYAVVLVASPVTLVPNADMALRHAARAISVAM